MAAANVEGSWRPHIPILVGTYDTLCMMYASIAVRKCSGYKEVNYCSNGCQKADWKVHKLVCSKFATFDFSTRPSDLHVLGFLFPSTEKMPQLVWLKKDHEAKYTWQLII